MGGGSPLRLATAIIRTPVNWILDADIRRFFDSVSQDWLVRLLELRIGDKRIHHAVPTNSRALLVLSSALTGLAGSVKAFVPGFETLVDVHWGMSGMSVFVSPR